MIYVSTRGKAPELSFEETMLTGLARDGGLYVPKSIPKLSFGDIDQLKNNSYEEIALRIIFPFVGKSFSELEIIDIIEKTYSRFDHKSRAPMKKIAENHFLLELFHGPTLAFKDFAMQFIGHMFQKTLQASGKSITIVGATSGDTGSAAIEAFRGMEAVNVFILFPDNRISEVQRRQMTTPENPNVHAIAVEGDFDDCQARVKDLFNDFAFRDSVNLAGINSINWARVLAQIVYYFFSAVSVGAPHQGVSFTVPTGNFGDVFAGYIAKCMGLPIEKLVVATNQNDILNRFFSSGKYEKKKVLPSISPSMDIQVSSNFERALFYACKRNSSIISQLMRELNEKNGFAVPDEILSALLIHYVSGRAGEKETLETIRKTLELNNFLLCPHTATAVHVANLIREPNTPMITLATAHPAKFPDAVERATGLRPSLPERMGDIYARKERLLKVNNDLNEIKLLIKERI